MEDGIESEVPAIVLVIPSCFQQIDKLREQIKVNSSIAAKRLRSHLIQFLSAAISQTQSKDLCFSCGRWKKLISHFKP
ncbi:microtubule-actin cross-linking factor 1, partial [Biomphalaria glabrata]